MNSLLIGHRGLAGLAPENTLASIRAAHQHGLGWIELDVQLSRDKLPVIFHDNELSRTSNGLGPLAQQDWSQLQQLDAGSWFSAQFSTETIPSLQQALQLISQLGLSLNLEFKCPADQAEALVKQCLPLIQAHQAPVWLSSFEPEIWQLCRQWLPEYPFSALFDALPNQAWLDVLQQLGIERCAVAASHWQPNWRQTIAKNLAVGVYTLNEQTQAQRIAAEGADWIFSDWPLTGFRLR